MTSDAETRYWNTKAGKLRLVLADGEWHHGSELAAKVGWRFGGALERVAKGYDKRQPWEIQRECLSAEGAVWRYRYVGPAVPAPKPESLKAKNARLERYARELEAQNAELRAHIDALTTAHGVA